MVGKDVGAFKEKIHFDRLAAMAGVDGIVADWSELAHLVTAELKSRKADLGDARRIAPGLVERAIYWNRKNGQLSARIFVSGTGYAPVRERLIHLVTETTRPDIPFQEGPADLGDLSIRSGESSAGTIIWVYRNVCVDLSDSEGADVEVVARLIQRFLESHRVCRLADHLPDVERVDGLSKEVRVGDDWRVSVRMGRKTRADSVAVEIRETAPELGEFRFQALEFSQDGATYRAVSPGTARVEIHVVDRKTLLSPPLAVSVEVLPAR